MDHLAIRADGLGKQYRIGGRQDGYRTLRDTLVESFAAPLRRARKLMRGQATGAADLDETIWALRDVSFEVKHGEVVGVIGRNGAGKSTLLKILSRITEPTEGYADVYGRVGSLLEVGTGFHPELTGRENIYLNGAILGMKRAEIANRFDEMVAFAEIEKFIDTPVKHYSSGMYVRLAFAVAAHLETEILLVDEVLAVGDAAFQRKCLGKMSGVAESGRTVLFVSHNMGAITSLCSRALLLDEGRLQTDDLTERVISRYLTSGASVSGRCVWEEGVANPGVDEIKVRSVCVRNSAGEVTALLDVRKPFEVEIEYEVSRPLSHCRVGIVLTTVEGVAVLAAYDVDNEAYMGERGPGRYISKCEIPGNLLNPGTFILSIHAGIRRVKSLVSLENVMSIEIEDIGAVGAHVGGRRIGIIRPKLEWWVGEARHDNTAQPQAATLDTAPRHAHD